MAGGVLKIERKTTLRIGQRWANWRTVHASLLQVNYKWINHCCLIYYCPLPKYIVFYTLLAVSAACDLCGLQQRGADETVESAKSGYKQRHCVTRRTANRWNSWRPGQRVNVSLILLLHSRHCSQETETVFCSRFCGEQVLSQWTRLWSVFPKVVYIYFLEFIYSTFWC